MQKKSLIIGANWKMNPAPAGFDAPDSPYRSGVNRTVIVFPSAIDLAACIKAQLTVGAQCGRPEANGAFTGDIAMKESQRIGCTHVLCGHSERREHHGETDEFIAEQMHAAQKNGLIPVLCIGENADQREMDETKEVLAEQLLRVREVSGMIIAYEPVWAIGSGKCATPDDVNEMHAFIRSLLKDKSTKILYGGSVTGKNAAEYFAQEYVDGALVGGASLKPDEFKKIVETESR